MSIVFSGENCCRNFSSPKIQNLRNRCADIQCCCGRLRTQRRSADNGKGSGSANTESLRETFDLEEAYSYFMSPRGTREVKQIIFEHFEYIEQQWEEFQRNIGASPLDSTSWPHISSP